MCTTMSGYVSSGTLNSTHSLTHHHVYSVEIFTPLYTSRVIQGIAIDKSEATFINAIIWMSILSAAR